MGVSVVEIDRLREVLAASVERARAEQDAADPLLSARELCERLGIARSTWRAYVSRHEAPPADDADLDRPEGSRIPRWRRSTVDAWKASRKRVWKKGA